MMLFAILHVTLTPRPPGALWNAVYRAQFKSFDYVGEIRLPQHPVQLQQTRTLNVKPQLLSIFFRHHRVGGANYRHVIELQVLLETASVQLLVEEPEAQIITVLLKNIQPR